MSVETVILTDASCGSEVRILAGYGFNCYRFCIDCDGELIDAIWANRGSRTATSGPPAAEFRCYSPTRGGSRSDVSGGAAPYRLEGDDHRGNAIHGYVIARPWRVIEREPSRVVGQFQASCEAPVLLEQWPSDFRLTATYELAGNTLCSRFLIENAGGAPMPCGFGTHPYFCVPLGSSRATTAWYNCLSRTGGNWPRCCRQAA